MKVVIVILCAIVTTINSRPQFGLISNVVPIVRNEVSIFLNGYSFNVETGDGFRHQARGEVLSYTGREEDQGLEVVGSYFYIGDDGRTYVVGYTAGKDGFRPYGIHIPPSAGVEQPGAGFGSCSATLAGCGLG